MYLIQFNELGGSYKKDWGYFINFEGSFEIFRAKYMQPSVYMCFVFSCEGICRQVIYLIVLPYSSNACRYTV